MSKSCHSVSIIVISLSLLAGTAAAQQPPDVVSSDGSGNTAMGALALNSIPVADPGAYNTAAGFEALTSSTTAWQNSAFGAYALFSNTTGAFNTGLGTGTLYNNTTGNYNTAVGVAALTYNTTGSNNTAEGFNALLYNMTGEQNTATGFQALHSNISGNDNVASGPNALFSNQKGNSNSAIGVAALQNNRWGSSNTAVGTNALVNNVAGGDNTAVGLFAGQNITGNNNIDINNPGEADDSGIIRIGSSANKGAYIAGIYGTSVSGNPVVVSSTGQLGVVVSSERYKTAIAPIGANTEKLQQLRPVSFHLKSDPDGSIQYGLIAEEVDKVYPELVIRDHMGTIQGVRYDELAPILLNEMQRQLRINASQAADINDLKQQLAQKSAVQDAEISALKKWVESQVKHQLVAQR
jgi:Chaperone of endosialidase